MSKSRIKLLNMVTNFKIGGTERQVVNMALRIDSAKFDLHLGCLQNWGELLQDLRALDVPRPEFRIGSLYGAKTMRQTIRLARYIRRNFIQVVHSYGFYSNVFTVPAARLAGARVIIASIRDMGEILTPLQRSVQKQICRFADCVLVNADAIRQMLIEDGYRRENIVVIHNGIVASQVAKQERGVQLRAELGLAPDTRIVMVASRLNPMKGIEYLLEAAAWVAGQVADVAFLIVGDGANRSELESRARAFGLASRVIFAGFRTDVPDLLLEATIVVLPSLSEGLSNSLLEAAAIGIPVIAAAVGGNPEVVEHGVTGILVPPKDSASLAHAMCDLLANPERARQMGEAGKRRVADRFAVDRAVGEIERLYEHLVETGGRV
ncbi:MAG TPA: glycosyltransferase [Bryobacteraceae bacterium]|nr:glycosyltransferase [Bryobacteraceae bacterium]